VILAGQSNTYVCNSAQGKKILTLTLLFFDPNPVVEKTLELPKESLALWRILEIFSVGKM
jgi:hypothetical protein